MIAQCYDIPVLKYGSHEDFRVLRYSHTLYGILVPRGFMWDGSSVPAALQFVAGKPWECKFQRASLLHDYLYVTHKADRAWADSRYYDLLRKDGAGVALAYAHYLGVRVGGAARWDANSRGHRIMSEAQVRVIERAAA